MTLRFAAIIAVLSSALMGGCPEFTATEAPTFDTPATEGEGVANEAPAPPPPAQHAGRVRAMPAGERHAVPVGAQPQLRIQNARPTAEP